MTLFEVVVHLILWPFNAAVYTYNVLALATGSLPSLSVVVVVGAIALLVSSALTVRRGCW
jgi:hypothetical protein